MIATAVIVWFIYFLHNVTAHAGFPVVFLDGLGERPWYSSQMSSRNISTIFVIHMTVFCCNKISPRYIRFISERGNTRSRSLKL
ncbi:hypothetical protein GGI43DRAFT_415837 [Trichoderma evansii]